MSPIVTRRQAVRSVVASGVVSLLTPRFARATAFAPSQERPAGGDYRLEFGHPLADLIGDLDSGERGDPQRESSIEHRHWYSEHVRRHYGAWGPPARRYLPLECLEQRSLEWQRERVIAAAARFIGYEYQHHHIPDWNPPAHWPWKHCCAGRNGRGFDCSNFTSFVYNQAFGIHFSSSIEQQARGTHSELNHGSSYRIERVDLPENYDARRRALCTGDLLYIRGREGGPITHVILWVGSAGRSPDDTPLILDSHGSDVVDDHGRPIPCGVHLRPYRPGSWYDRCTSHAHRLFG